MKKVYNKIIPMKGFKALTVWPFIFIHSSYADRFNDIDTNVISRTAYGIGQN